MTRTNLFSKLLFLLERKMGIYISQLKYETLLGKKYKVFGGAIRNVPDYDDAWLFALSREVNYIFDIGCNIGQSSLLMLHANKVQEIILVDPNPMALSQAAQNLILNGFSPNARFICAFVSDKSGESIEFFTVGTGAAGSMYEGHAQTASNINAKISVPTITIDSLVQRYNIFPGLVKIDVEGAESFVLNGAKQLDKHQKSRFFIEMHSPPELPMVENVEKVINWCHNTRYQAWYLKDKQLLVSPKQIAHRGRCHLLLLPSHETFPSSLLSLKQGARLEDVVLQS